MYERDFQNSLNRRPRIGLVLDYPAPELVAGARDYCEQNQLFLDARWAARGDWMPASDKYDAVMAGVASGDQSSKELLDRLRRMSCPKLWLMRGQLGPSVLLDMVSVGKLAARELHKGGFKRLLALQIGQSVSGQLFCTGMRTYAEAKGVEFSIFHSRVENPGENLGEVEKEFVQAIVESQKPLGVATPHAAILFNLQGPLIDAGLVIGRDLGMVSLDKDLEDTVSSMAPVPISAVSPNFWHHGFVAAEMAHAMLEGRPLREEQVLIPGQAVIQRESTGACSKRDLITGRALGYLRENFRKPIDVSNVVESVGVSRRVLELRFRALMGSGVHEEIARLRIKEAKRLLIEEPSMKIAEVAENCGLGSIYYFSAAFKRETGLSPRAYRNSVLEDLSA